MPKIFAHLSIHPLGVLHLTAITFEREEFFWLVLDHFWRFVEVDFFVHRLNR
jgi:hypothetical protein